MNVDGAANERALGRTVMPIYHAMFSVGTIIGAGTGALAEHLGVPIVVHLTAVAAVMTVAVLIAVRFLQPDPALSAADEEKEAAGKGDWRRRLAVWRDRRTLLIGLIVLGMAFAEGSANDWLALAMVDGHGVDNATGALVFGIFVTAMTIGRVFGVVLLDRFGRVPVLRVSALLAGVGLTTMIVAPNPGLAAAWQRARRAALQDIRKDPERYYAFHADVSGFPVEAVKASYPLSQFPEEAYPSAWIQSLEDVKAFLRAENLIRQDFAVNDWKVAGL